MKKYILAAILSFTTIVSFAQTEQYSELGGFGKILRFEPGTAAKKAGTAAMNATPREAAAAVAGTYVAYKSFKFVGKNPVLAGSVMTVGYVLANPQSAEAHVRENPEDVEKMYQWLEDQKQAHPERASSIAKMQDKIVATAFSNKP